MKFSEVKINEEFFDSLSGDYFRKNSSRTAIQTSNGEFFGGEEYVFDPDEEVFSIIGDD